MSMERSRSEVDLPGFRFHPTDEELLSFYLKERVHSKNPNFDVIGTINLYRYDPSELPGLARIGEREWYFFVPRDHRKQAATGGGRPNRTTERGFWKATGSDRRIRSTADPKRGLIGLKKTLVFYEGRAPHGSKTDWVMNEYRLPDNTMSPSPSSSSLKEDIVLCKIYKKATSLKELEQRAAREEEARASQLACNASIADTLSSSNEEIVLKSSTSASTTPGKSRDGKDFISDQDELHTEFEISSTPLSAARSVSLPELQLPLGLEWMQDPFLTQLRSPWLDQWSPLANLLNF